MEKTKQKSFFAQFALAILLLSTFSIAQVDTTEEEIQPGAINGLDRALENLRVAFAFSQTRKAELELEHLNERLAEAEELLKEGDLERYEEIRTRYEEKITRVQERINQIEDTDKEAQYRKITRIEEKLEKHQDKAARFETRIRIRGDLTVDQRAALEAFIDSLGENIDRTDIRIRQKQAEVEDEIPEATKEERYQVLAQRKIQQAEDRIQKAQERITEFEERKKERFSEEISDLEESISKDVAATQRRIAQIESRIIIKEREGDIDEDLKLRIAETKQRLAEARTNTDTETIKQLRIQAYLADLEADNEASIGVADTEIYPEDTKLPEGYKKERTFETCAAAGNPVMESNPRQCTDEEGITYTELHNGQLGGLPTPPIPDGDKTTTYPEYEEIPESDILLPEDVKADVESVEEEFEQETELEEEFDDRNNEEKELLQAYGLRKPKDLPREPASAQAILELAKKTLETAKESYEKAEYKKAFAHATYAKLLANEAASGKWYRITDTEKQMIRTIKEQMKEREDTMKETEKAREEIADEREDRIEDIKKEIEDLEKDFEDAETQTEKDRITNQITILQNNLERLMNQ